jgi:hypothetical protein
MWPSLVGAVLLIASLASIFALRPRGLREHPIFARYTVLGSIIPLMLTLGVAIGAALLFWSV